MASGSISGSTNNRYIVAQINWQSYSNTDGNYSDVNAQLFYRRTNSGYTTSGTIAGNLNIDGTDYGYGGHVSIGSGWVQVASASKRVYHNNDGTRFIWIGASGGISGTSFTSTSCGSGVNLDTISRASGMGLSTSTIAAGGSFTVNISPHSSGFSHWIDITGVGDQITYEVAAGVTSCTCTIPKERVTTFPNSQSAQATVWLNTKNGSGHDTKIGVVSQAITVTVPSDVKPSLTTPTLTDSTKAYSLLNAFAANYSKVTVATTASVYKDDDFTDTATISSVTANYNGQNYDASSGSFTFVPSTAGTSDMTITVTDSRGKTVTQTVSIPVVAYTRPTVTLSASRYADSAGTTADDTGAYAKVTAVCTLDTIDVADNSATVTLKYQKVGGTDWDTVDMGTITAGSTLSAVIPASDTKAYTLIATISDKIATTGATMALSNGAVPMDFLKGGKGIAVGKTATREGLDIAFPTYVEGGKVYVDGKTILDKFFPIGKTWISTDPTSPASIVGGSWEQIKGRFILAADNSHAAGTTGGNGVHSHRYGLHFWGFYNSIVAPFGAERCMIMTHDYKSGDVLWDNNNYYHQFNNYPGKYNAALQSQTTQNNTISTYFAEGDTATEEVIPPYFSAYVWRRIG